MASCPRWHRLGERCECGFIGTPARFYLADYGGGPTQEEALAAYLKWAKEAMPELYARLAANKVQTANKAVVSEVANTDPAADVCTVCNQRPCRPRGTTCWKCYRERAKV